MNSSTTRGMRWISSIKMIEPSPALVRKGIKSPGLLKAGPLVIWIVVPSSLGSTVANVVLPRPGGPSKRMCASGSFSFLLPLIKMRNRSTTAFWPITSRSQRGRKASSRRRSSSGGSPPPTMVSRGISYPSPENTASGLHAPLLVDFQDDLLGGLEFPAACQHLIEPGPRFHGAMPEVHQRLIGFIQY